jgi:ABC-type glycerol-3-phosphate transport system substrate-binding protein
MILGAHANNTTGQMTNFPDARLWDTPLPSFVAGAAPHYYVPGIAGLSLAASLEPGGSRARIGAALYRLVLSPEGSLVVADNYGGAILSRGLYESPRFKETRFGALRATLAQQVLPRTQMLNLVVPDSTTQPGFRAAVTKALSGQVSTKAALAEIQQLFDVKEEAAWRTLG